MSLQTLAIIGMSPLRALLSGAPASLVPAPATIGANACVILVFLGIVVTTQPAWKHIEGHDPH